MRFRSHLQDDKTKKLQIDHMDHLQPIIIKKKTRTQRPFLLLLPNLLFLIGYFFTPFPTRLIVLGIDETPPGTYFGRSDTILLIKLQPALLHASMMSIPRDLWVPIDGYGENRINTAHFFAELDNPGSGAISSLKTINQLFGLDFHYYVRFSFEGFKQIIDSLGGITITIDKQTAGLSAGRYHLNGEQALEFVRERKSADDFARMQNAQTFITAFVIQLLKPEAVPHYPNLASSLFNAIDTNIPFWQYPRLAVALLLGIITGPDTNTIDRAMVTPITTSEGANVLLPEWSIITPYIQEKVR